MNRRSEFRSPSDKPELVGRYFFLAAVFFAGEAFFVDLVLVSFLAAAFFFSAMSYGSSIIDDPT